MDRSTHQEVTAVEKMVCYPEFPRGGGMPRHAGPQRGSTRSQKEQGESTSKSLDCGFHRKEWAREGKQLSRFRV